MWYEDVWTATNVKLRNDDVVDDCVDWWQGYHHAGYHYHYLYTHDTRH